MQININKLKSEIKNLDILLEEYENNYLNLYNQVFDLFNHWNDTRAKKFEIIANEDKIKVETSYNELNSLKKVYENLINKYEKIGNQIDIVLNDTSLMLKINAYIEKFDNVINAYNNLDLYFCKQEGLDIDEQKQVIIQNKKKILNFKYEIQSLINYVSETEKEISSMLSKIDIEFIELKEMEIW